MHIPIIIPSYEPDDRLLKLLDSLLNYGAKDIIIVNDGSSQKFEYIFIKAKKILERTTGGGNS